ncbi:50S ribosomal protein L32 [Chondromyces crocatus]|uniref:Large ribosomal subunit protein bL32 n=1 Tax=Chondromyces crocatus TaxID=52 RepID=A0A0K1EGG5_CHOCO|nr:50S ribosomal protein L32 [Chondromyces crocatus]AKT39960.1 50S ribosomal protein L32 [Chondromyces crocatus]
MAVPKRKKTPPKRDMRRAQHDKVTPVQVISCENCGEARLPHRACGSCGHYKGRKAAPTGSENSGS